MNLQETYSIEDLSYYRASGSLSYANNSLNNFIKAVDISDDFKASVKITRSTSSNNTRTIGIACSKNVYTDTSLNSNISYVMVGDYSSTYGTSKVINGSWSALNRTNGKLSQDTEYLYELQLEGTTLTAKITQTSNDSVVFTDSRTFSNSISPRMIGFHENGTFEATYTDFKILEL